jgi:predicted ATP-dependent endonuclease of OLD family
MMSGNARTFPAFDPARRASSASEMKQRYQDLRSADPSLSLPTWSSKAAAEQTLKTWELENPDRLEDSAVTVTNLFGFAGQAVMSGLFDYVFVSADMRASEESRDGRTALIGRILERTVDRSAADDDIRALAASVEAQQEEIFERNFKEQLLDLSTALSSAVGQYTVGRTVKVQASKQEIKPPRTQFDLSIVDFKIDTSVEKQGHGFQRTLLVAALQLLAERGSAGNGIGAICLAIEEPELFQHPVQARSFASVLRKLAENQSQNFQVTYATHSPHFIDAGKFHQVRRVTRATWAAEGSSPAVTVQSTSIAEVEKLLAGRLKSVLSQLDAVAASKLPEALFSSAAVLVEGGTEKAVFEGIAEKAALTSLLSRGIAVVDLGGKSNIMLAHAILTELGIPCYVVFDGDKGGEERARRNGKTEERVNEEVRQHRAENRKLLEYLDAEEEDFPGTAVHARYAVLEDTLETLLESEWTGWQDEIQRVTDAGLAAGKKNALMYLIAARQIASHPPQFLRDVLQKVHLLVS